MHSQVRKIEAEPMVLDNDAGDTDAKPVSLNRTRLAELLAAREALAETATARRAAVDRLRSAEAGEKSAQSDFDTLLGDEARAMREWAQSGEGVMPAPNDEARRKVGKALATATATAEAARAAIPNAEQELREATAALAANGAAASAVIDQIMLEELDPIYAEIADAYALVRARYLKIAGLEQLLHDRAQRTALDEGGRELLNRLAATKERRVRVAQQFTDDFGASIPDLQRAAADWDAYGRRLTVDAEAVRE